jgi:hypothetical protein
VTQISGDGQSDVPRDYRWRRLIFDFPSDMAIQQMDDSFTYYGATINPAAKTLALTGSKSKGNFTFQRLSGNELALVGNMDGQQFTSNFKSSTGASFSWSTAVSIGSRRGR